MKRFLSHPISHIKTNYEILYLAISCVILGHSFTLEATRTSPRGGADSSILVRGSDITAGQDATLAAEGDIRLQAAQNTASLSGNSSSSSGSIGVSVGANRHYRQCQQRPWQSGR
jgi:hypothetical protein